MPDRGLEAFLSPSSVAVIGASDRPESVGHAVLANLLGRRGGPAFAAPVYPVNPKGGEILGHQVYESLAAIEGDLDLIVVCIPPRFIPGVMTEAGAKNVAAAIVISAGFAEMGEPGLALQAEMLEAARAAGIRIIGPNCLGVIRPINHLNASFAAAAPPPGKIGLLSQSGALITGVISYAEVERFGLSAAISLGAKADVNDLEIIELLDADPETAALAIYVEAFPEPRQVYEALRRCSKPVVALKGGATAAGARAAASHTGSLAGSMAAYRAAFAQAGAVLADGIGDFLGFARALAHQPPAPGNRLAIVTNAGGPGVISADEAGRHGIELATLSPETLAALDKVLPAVWSRNNPIDVVGDATPERYRDALNIVGAAPEVDGVVVIMTVQAMTDPMATAAAIAEAAADPSWSKPLVSSFLGLAGTEAGSYLDARGVPELATPEQAVAAMGALMQRGARLRRPAAPATELPAMPAPDLDRARAVLAEARAAGQKNLDLDRARQALAAAGIRYNGSGTAQTAADAVRVADEIGYPVVIKVISPDVIHKSDVGGVVLDCVSAADVEAACAAISSRIRAHDRSARITGFTVEEQVSGTEIIVGVSRDPGFGPLLMVGMGGIFVEVYKDVTFRLIPLERADALEMIDEIRAQALLDGARARPVLDRGELAEVILRIARMVEEIPEIEELDINPLVITADRGLVAIDARVIAG
jgi:acetyltransferase